MRLRAYILFGLSLLLGANSLAAEGHRITQEILNKAQFSDSQIRSELLEDQNSIKKIYQALWDPDGRISDVFKVPKKMKWRVRFWLDVYTKYSKNEHVIHHSKYPWLVYEVVDTRPIANSKLHRWTKYHRSKALVKNRRRIIKNSLKRLAKRKSYRGLKGIDRKVYNTLKSVPGKRRAVFKEALKNYRVQLGQKDFFVSGIINSTQYLPYMSAEFRAVGLPEELARIPLVESSFNLKAHSKVGAAGVWQIMPHIGKHYMIVDKYIDERLSPIKATLVASDILKTNYRLFKDWPLTVSSYNAGSGYLKKAMKKSRTKNLPDLIDAGPTGAFGFASMNFYASFLAALHAEKYKHEIFGDEIKDSKQPIRMNLHIVKAPTKANRIHLLTESDPNRLLEFNPDIREAHKKKRRLPRGFKIFVPEEG